MVWNMPTMEYLKRMGSIPIGSMYAIYGNMDPSNIPQMLALPWILWNRGDS